MNSNTNARPTLDSRVRATSTDRVCSSVRGPCAAACPPLFCRSERGDGIGAWVWSGREVRGMDMCSTAGAC
eukprot:4452938-Prymnesium_polylepis.1